MGSCLLETGHDPVPARDGTGTTIVVGALVVLSVIGGLGLWSITAPIDGAILAAGRVTIDGNRKAIQHYEGGIVREILVQEGAAVRAGETLVILDDTIARGQLAVLDARLDEVSARQARLTAERDGAAAITFAARLRDRRDLPPVLNLLRGETAVFETRRDRLGTETALLRDRQTQLAIEIDGLEQQRDSIERAIAILTEQHRVAAGLLAKSLARGSQVQGLAREIEEKRAEAAALSVSIAERTGDLGDVDLEVLRLRHGFAEQVAARLRETEAQFNDLNERRAAIADQLRRTRIIAPREGVVLNLAFHTVGGIVAPGETLMEIVPRDEHLVIEARVRLEDIDKVLPGAPARVRFTAFNQRMTPQAAATVRLVSADQIRDDGDAPPFYRAVLDLSPDQLARTGHLRIRPGMPAEIFIRTGERTALAYLLKPLTDSLRRAFRED